MLFVLDQDVDDGVRRIITTAGHHCVNAAQIGLSSASDDEVSIWADNHQAVVVTHDREFSQRRRRNTFGRHVWLNCADVAAVAVVTKHLVTIAQMLDDRDSVVLRVTQDQVTYHAGQWQ